MVIVGAGPIGCYLAHLLKKRGLGVLLIEEHKEIGRPVHCAGLVGKKVFEETQIPLSTDCILNTINGAVVNLGADSLELRQKNVAYVVDREVFDKNLGAGLEILFETRFLGLEEEKGAYIVETDKGDLKADIVVGADGARSLVREFINSPDRVQHLKGVQFRMECNPSAKDRVEVFVEQPFFYWIVPESEKVARVGVISESPYYDLLEFVDKNGLKGRILEKFAGIVPLTHFRSLSRDRVFLVGDSASQIKPLTYGGIYMGMRGAEKLTECILQNRFSDYSYRWAKRFGREANISLRAREAFQNLDPEDIRKIFTFAKKNTNIIEERADFESHASLVWEFLKNPGNSSEFAHILLKIFKANLKGSFS